MGIKTKSNLSKPKGSSYREEHISYFSTDLKKIRAKPQMYIGPTDDSGIFTILRECLDNSVDEARAGRNKVVHAFTSTDGFWVADEGVGIPVKKHPEAKISTLTYVLTVLQSSGKMRGDAYKSAIGTHGVGQKATNALSSHFEVWTYREDAGGWHYTRFASGEEKVGVKKSKAPKLPNGKTAKKGTVIHFIPDKKIFGSAKLDLAQLKTWCEITAYMNAGLKVCLTTKKGDREWYSTKGIEEYLEKRLTELKATALNKKVMHCSLDNLDLALSFADVEGCEIQYYTNTIRNRDEGFHAVAFGKAFVDSLKPYKGKLVYTPADLREGVVGVLNYKIDAPQFSSQTKEKLVDLRVSTPCYETCLKVLSEYFKANKSLAKQLCSRAAELRSKTADFLKDKKLSRNVKKAKSQLPQKLSDCNQKCPVEFRELFLVEGDSASGPCFPGNTQVLLSSGETKSFEDLVSDSAEGLDINLVSFNLKTQTFENSIAEDPRITGYTDTLVKITYSDGSSDSCTPDHLFLTVEDGKNEYKKAKDLLPGIKVVSK